MLLGGSDHHLGRELHPGGAQIQLGQHVASERAHPAVGVIDPGPEQQVEKAREQRVADVAVMPGHRARVDVLHPVADHHVGAVLQLGEEVRDLAEVVGEIGVGHHDVATSCHSEPRHVGASIAPLWLVDHDRTRRAGKTGTAVVGVVVGDDDLARDAVVGEHARARRTHSSMFSASLRHGITTDTTRPSPAANDVGSDEWCSSVLIAQSAWIGTQITRKGRAVGVSVRRRIGKSPGGTADMGGA